jgi:hypothetical protein
MPTIIKSFRKLKDSELDDKAEEVITALSNPPGSTNFPTPQPTIADVNAALTAYQNSLTAAANGGTTLVTTKNLRRKELEKILNKLAKYCELGADDDIEKMQSTGFDVSKDKAPVGQLEQTTMKAEPTLPGTVKVSCDVVEGANTYQWEWQEDGTAGWESKSTTASRTTIAGLTSGKKYNFRVVPIGADPTKVYSAIVSTFIL